MKTFFKYILIFFSFFILFKLVSGTIVIKGLFQNPQRDTVKEVAVDYNNYKGTDTIPNDYLKILNLKEPLNNNKKDSVFYLTHTFRSNRRNPILFFTYKSQYYLQLYKIDSTYKLSLRNGIRESYINAHITYNITYDAVDEDAVEYNYNHLYKNPNVIFFRLFGKNTHIILKDDSIAYYYSNFNNFSMQYNPSEPDNIYAETRDKSIFSTTYIPLEVMFIKRNNCLYLLTMYAHQDGKKSKYVPGTLYNLIKNGINN